MKELLCAPLGVYDGTEGSEEGPFLEFRIAPIWKDDHGHPAIQLDVGEVEMLAEELNRWLAGR